MFENLQRNIMKILPKKNYGIKWLITPRELFFLNDIAPIKRLKSQITLHLGVITSKVHLNI